MTKGDRVITIDCADNWLKARLKGTIQEVYDDGTFAVQFDSPNKHTRGAQWRVTASQIELWTQEMKKAETKRRLKCYRKARIRLLHKSS
jgi:hypothetical protein